jgi:hypothetical protein
MVIPIASLRETLCLIDFVVQVPEQATRGKAQRESSARAPTSRIYGLIQLAPDAKPRTTNLGLYKPTALAEPELVANWKFGFERR